MKKLILIFVFLLSYLVGLTQIKVFTVETLDTLRTYGIMQHDTSYNVSETEPIGSSYWDEDNQTLSIVLGNGVIGQVFKEAFIDGQNDTGSEIADGTPVMYAGSIGNSGNFRIVPAYASDTLPAFMFVGLVTEPIQDGDIGKITTRGKLRGIQTNGDNYGEEWDAGDIIYLSTVAGELTNVAPDAPYPAIPVALVISSHHNNGTLEVRPTYPQRVTELVDVNGTPLTTSGQIMVWDESNDYFDFDVNILDSLSLIRDTTDALRIDINNISTGSSPWTETVDSVYVTGKNVGIGTSSPQFNLHINGGALAVQQFSTTTSGATSSDGLVVGVDDVDRAFLFNRENTDMYLGTNGNSRIYIQADGDVGIGTDAPETKLHTKGNVRIGEVSYDNSYFDIINSDDATFASTEFKRLANAGLSRLDFSPIPNDGTSISQVRFFRLTNTTGAASIDIHSADGTSGLNSKLSANGNSYLNAITGNVGLGTSSPQFKFNVEADTIEYAALIHNDYTTGKGLHIMAGSPSSDNHVLKLETEAGIDVATFYSNGELYLPKLPSSVSESYVIGYDPTTDKAHYFPTPTGGDVSKTGTPVNNQIAIWTDADTIEGDPNLFYNGNYFGTGDGKWITIYENNQTTYDYFKISPAFSASTPLTNLWYIGWHSSSTDANISGGLSFYNSLNKVSTYGTTAFQITTTLLDSDGDAGTSGQVFSSTGTGTNWISPSGGVSDGDKGDITVSSSGTVWNIDAGVVGSTELASTSVTPNSYTRANITVDSDGRITAASNGTSFGETFADISLNSTDEADQTITFSEDDFVFRTSDLDEVLSLPQTNSGTAEFYVDVSTTGDLSVTDEAYGTTWNGSTDVPTKNAVYDKFEELSVKDTIETTEASETWTGDKVFTFSRGSRTDELQIVKVTITIYSTDVTSLGFVEYLGVISANQATTATTSTALKHGNITAITMTADKTSNVFTITITTNSSKEYNYKIVKEWKVSTD